MSQDQVVKMILQGTVEVGRWRGGQKRKWGDDTIAWAGKTAKPNIGMQQGKMDNDIETSIMSVPQILPTEVRDQTSKQNMYLCFFLFASVKFYLSHSLSVYMSVCINLFICRSTWVYEPLSKLLQLHIWVVFISSRTCSWLLILQVSLEIRETQNKIETPFIQFIITRIGANLKVRTFDLSLEVILGGIYLKHLQYKSNVFIVCNKYCHVSFNII